MHTNQTAHYNLPQFLASDKGTWLNDLNGAFFDIDTQMFKNSQTADSAVSAASNAQAKADSVQKNVEGLTAVVDTITEDVSSAGTSIQTLTNQVNNLNTTISGIGTKATQNTQKMTEFYTRYKNTIESGQMVPSDFVACGDSIGDRLKALEAGGGTGDLESQISSLTQNLSTLQSTTNNLITEISDIKIKTQQVQNNIANLNSSMNNILTKVITPTVTITGISGLIINSAPISINVYNRLCFVSGFNFNGAVNASGKAVVTYPFPTDIANIIDTDYTPSIGTNIFGLVSSISATWKGNNLECIVPEETNKSSHGIVLTSFIVKLTNTLI